jgi:hypothetical protein
MDEDSYQNMVGDLFKRHHALSEERNSEGNATAIIVAD